MRHFLVRWVVVLVVMAPTQLRAATPESGTLTENSGSLNFTSGPYRVSNPTPAPMDAGPRCGANNAVVTQNPCDHYTLTINFPSDWTTRNNGEHANDIIKVTMTWNDSAGASDASNFDIYLYKGMIATTDGSRAADHQSATQARSEVVTFPAASDSSIYSVLVVPFTVSSGFTEVVNVKVELVNGSAPPDEAPPSTVRRVDGELGDWAGVSPMIGGESVMSRGEFIYQDYIHDDAGAAVLRDPDAVVDQNYHGGLQPAGTYFYPNNPQRYGSNAADLFQFRAARLGDSVYFLVHLNTLLAPDSTVVGIALGNDETTPMAWPLGAGLSTPGTQHVLTLWGTGGAFDGRGLNEVGGEVAVSVKNNVIEASLPLSLVGEQFRAYVASGLWDNANNRWMPVAQQARTTLVPGGGDGAHPNIFNVAFRFDEPDAVPGRTWWENKQAAALRDGDIAKYRADINLSAADTPERIIRGWHQRIYRAPVTVAPHEGITEATAGAPTGGSVEAHHGKLHFLGPWQPYAVYVPENIERMTLLLHGAGQIMFTEKRGLHRQLGDARNSILVEPLGRGMVNFYKNEAYVSVLDAVRDAVANYPVDPALTTIGGLSMGGSGTSRFITTRPDMFAAAIPFNGCYGEVPQCGSNDPPLDYWENIRNVPVMLNHGVQDRTVYYPLPQISLNRLEALQYRYEFLSNAEWGHNTVQAVDDYQREFAFLDAKRIDPNPPHVTFKTPAEVMWAPQLSPDLVFDRAYWVSGLRVRDTSLGAKATGTVDAITHGRGGEDLVTERVDEQYPEGPPAPYVVQARRAVAGAAQIVRANRFTATLTNLRLATFDLPRMGLSTVETVTASLTTDGAADVRLLKGAGCATVQGASTSIDGGDLLVRLPLPGVYALSLLAPLPRLGATPARGNFPLAVSFDASGSGDPAAGGGIASYIFDFGDGSAPVTQSGATASHTYQTAGEYLARLRVTDRCGHISAISADVPIAVGVPNTLPVAGLTANPATQGKGRTLVLDASSSSDADNDALVEYSFHCGVANATLTHETPSSAAAHCAYPVSGGYSASVRVRDTRGGVSVSPATLLLSITNAAPSAALASSAFSGHAPLTVEFDASASSDPDPGDGPVLYVFNFGDGVSEISFAPMITHTYVAPGNYNARVSVEDNEGLNSDSAALLLIRVLNETPVARLAVNPVTQGKGRVLTLDASTSSDPDHDAIAEYSFSCGSAGATLTHESPSAAIATCLYPLSGRYGVSLGVKDSFGETSKNPATLEVIITNTRPIAILRSSGTLGGQVPLTVNFDASESSDSDPGDRITQYQFDFGDGTQAVMQSNPTLSHSYKEAGEYRATLTVRDAENLQSSPGELAIVVAALPIAQAQDNRRTGGSVPAWSLLVLGGFAWVRRRWLKRGFDLR